MISTPFEYSRATSLEDALARLRAANGDGKFVAGGHSLIPLMKLRLSEPGTLIDIARIPGLSGIRKTVGKIEIGAGNRPPRRGHIRVAAASLSRWWPRPRQRSAIRRSAIAARSAAAWPMPIPRPTTRP